MLRLVCLVVALAVAIGCSKSKTPPEANSRGDDPKPAPKADPNSTKLPKTEMPEALPEGKLAEFEKQFESAKGKVDYVSDINYLGLTFVRTKIAPGTFKNFDPYSPYLTGLTLLGCNVTDAELQSLPELPWLQTLDLQHTKGFTDAGIKKLTSMKRLTHLELIDTPITDDGLTGLTGLPALQRLGLGRTRITDIGLKYLAHLSNLATLVLEKTEITGSGYTELAGLKKLNVLVLDDSKVTDAGLANLPALPELRFLSMNNTGITDEGLKALARINPGVTSLDLKGTKITDAGIQALLSMPNLFSVSFNNTKATLSSVDAIRSKFPQCHVSGP